MFFLHLHLQHSFCPSLSFYFSSFFTSVSYGYIPRLVVALAKTQTFVFFLTGLLTFLEGSFRVTTPIILGMFLNDLQDDDSPAKNIFLLAFMLSVFNMLQTFTHHVVFYYTMRLGYTFRTVTIGMIFNRLFTLPGSALDSSVVDTGKLINLISNDVQRFEEAAVFFHFLWSSLLEASTILIFLSLQLNFLSGLAGVGMTVLAIPVQLKVAKELSKRRGKVARSTDTRVRFMSEVITGISSVKSFAWENSFFATMSSIRMTEVNYMRFSLILKSINYALYFCSPHVASLTTFMAFVSLGGTLTLPKVFTVMSLLQVLRLVIGRAWTRAIETSSEAIASCHRIESFLVLADVSEIEDVLAHSSTGSSTATDKEESPGDGIEGETSGVSAMTRQRGEVVATIPVNCCFSYENNSSHKTTLQNIKLSIAFGEVLMIVGPGKCNVNARIVDFVD
jgi:ATP-binding cassette, subfamily C (CFTR/MRP), member 4